MSTNLPTDLVAEMRDFISSGAASRDERTRALVLRAIAEIERPNVPGGTSAPGPSSGGETTGVNSLDVPAADDPQVECTDCGWHGKLSESTDGSDYAEDMPICPDCFLKKQVVPVSIASGTRTTGT